MIKMFNKKTWISIMFLFSVLLLKSPMLDAAENNDFSLEVLDDNLMVLAGGNVTTEVLVNQTSGSTGNVSLYGRWVNGDKPSSMRVEISNSSGLPSFSSTVRFISGSGSEAGKFIYNLTADRGNVSHSADIEVVVSNFSVNVSTDKENYEQYDTIHVSGDINSEYGEFFSGDVFLDFDFLDGAWKRTVAVSVVNNSFEFDYNISFGDPPSGDIENPEAVWRITASIFDSGVKIEKSKKINVSIPSGGIYTVIWESPAEGTVYQRGDTFTISTDVLKGNESYEDVEEGTPVVDALSRCVLPNLKVINLSEKSDGYYYNTYRIPYDSPTGKWFLSAYSVKNNSGTLNFGGSFTYIKVEPVKLNMTLLEPDSNISSELYPGDEIYIKVDLRYPDDTPVTKAKVNASFLSENLTLIHQKQGIYSVNYTIKEEDIGNWFIHISAMDENNNYGSSEQSIYVYNKTVPSEKKEKNDFPFMTVFAVLSACIVGIFVLRFTQKRFSKQHLEDVQTEIKEIKRLQNEAVEKYYKKGTINRPTYDSLRQEYEERLDELKKEEQKIKK